MRTLDDLGDVDGQARLRRASTSTSRSTRRRRSPTTRASAPRCRRSSELRDARRAARARRAPRRPKGREPELSLRPVAARLGELLGGPTSRSRRRPGATSPRRRRRACSRTCASSRARRRTTPSSRGATPRWPTPTSTTRSAPRTARTRRPTASRTLLPSAAGLLLQREVETLQRDPRATRARPLVAIVGGAKVTDKIGVLDAFLRARRRGPDRRRDVLPVLRRRRATRSATSLCEEEGIEPARARARATARDKAARCPSTSCSATRFAADAERRELDGVDVPDGWMGLDVGPRTARGLRARASPAPGTVFWNGPMGAFELEPFAAGTRAVAEAVADCAGDDRRRRRRQRRGAARSSGSRTRSPTSRPAAARRSS